VAGGLIQTYSDLTSAVIEYLARDQDNTLIARVPWFVQSAEAKLNRTLLVRQMENRQTALTTYGVTDAEYIAVPSDFQSMRRIRLTSVSGRPQLDYMSATQMEDARTEQGDVAAQPEFYTFTGNEIELYPIPDAAYTVELVYRQYLPALASNSTNWLLTLAPDIYLYGALLESAPYLKKDVRLQTWATLYAAAVKDLNALEASENFNAGSLRVRPEGFNVF